MQVRSPTTIAILGGNMVAGLALSFLLKGVGYGAIILKVPPTGSDEDLLRHVDLLLVSPDPDDGRRRESLAILRGIRKGLRVPVLAFSATVEENVSCGILEIAGNIGCRNAACSRQPLAVKEHKWPLRRERSYLKTPKS